MAYEHGAIGPIVYSQDNSGVNTDIDTTIRYSPQEFGAPATAQVITPSVSQSYHVSRGKAYVHNVNIEANEIVFQVYTQAANDGLFGWHSGSISVATRFEWYTE